MIQTRSGTKIVMNDAEGSIFIEDPSGNTYLMDGQGNIKVNAPNDMDFTVGKDLNMQVGNNINMSAGLNMNTSVGQNATTNVGMQYSLFAGDSQYFKKKHKNISLFQASKPIVHAAFNFGLKLKFGKR